MTPDFKIIAAGVNITAQIKDRLLSLVVSDEAGMKSDQVEITLDDRGSAIELPAPGALLAVFMGYKESVLVPMGLFTADEICVSGPPETMVIRGKAAALGGELKDQKTRSWDDKTIGQIVAVIAREHKLTPKVSSDLAGVKIEHADQTEESDLHFLMRLAEEHDAIASVKGQTLLFIDKGEGKTASGLAMIPQQVSRKGCLRWSATLATRGEFASVEACWHDKATGSRARVCSGSGSPVRKLRHIFPGEAEAQRAADGELRRCKRGNTSLSIGLVGSPLMAAEGRLLATGFRPGVDGLWSIKSVRHQISSGGFVTEVEAEAPNSE